MAVVFAVAASTFTPITSGLIGWWKLDDSGSTAVDSSGAGRTGTLVGSPTWTTGKSGGGLQFANNSQYISTTVNSGYVNGTQAFSATMWLFPTSTLSSIVLMSTAISTSPWDGIWIQRGTGFGVGVADDIIFGMSDTTGSVSIHTYSAANSCPNNLWTHIAVTYDGSNSTSGLLIYLNGSSVAVTAGGSPIGTFTNRPFYIDGMADNSSGSFVGTMDDVRFYNRVLLSEEVSSIYNLTG